MIPYNYRRWGVSNSDVTLTTLQMFAGIYRVFTGKSECGDFKFTGIVCIPTIPVIFEVNTLCGLLIYTLNYDFFQISLQFLW